MNTIQIVLISFASSVLSAAILYTVFVTQFAAALRSSKPSGRPMLKAWSNASAACNKHAWLRLFEPHPVLNIKPKPPAPTAIKKEEAYRQEDQKAFIEEIKRLHMEIRHLKDTKFHRFNNEDRWIYQGDGTDNLESLSCPVVIAPKILMDFVNHYVPDFNSEGNCNHVYIEGYGCIYDICRCKRCGHRAHELDLKAKGIKTYPMDKK